MREWLFLECTHCGNRFYRTNKNTKAQTKIEVTKFCNVCRAHKPHKEKKK